MSAEPVTGPIRLTDEAVIPLSTLDPTAPLDDLQWLDEVVGDARVVAIGESAHYNREFYELRHRILRYLVERHGFGAYALESGFTEGWMTADWLRNGSDDPEQLSDVLANGVTSLMGLWTQLRAQLNWMRQHNRTSAHPVTFYGIDLPGSNASLLPGLDAVIAYLAEADPEFQVDPSIRDAASACMAESPFSVPAAVAAYAELSQGRRDALTAGLADLTERLTSRSVDYRRRTGSELYERALRSARITATLDAMVREMTRGDRHSMMFSRDAAIADTVEWILRREDRIVVAAHNGHVQRCPVALPGIPPSTMMGMQLGDRLGESYVVIGTTSGTGQTLNADADFYTGKLFTDLEGAPASGSLDAVMGASHDSPFATDLRRLSPADTDTVRAVSQQRFGGFYSDLSPLDAYDAIVHIPHVTAAEPDQGALAHAPLEVQKVFSHYRIGGS